MTRSKRFVLAENEGKVTVKEQVVVEDVIEEENDEKQKRETPIIVNERKRK